MTWNNAANHPPNDGDRVWVPATVTGYDKVFGNVRVELPNGWEAGFSDYILATDEAVNLKGEACPPETGKPSCRVCGYPLLQYDGKWEHDFLWISAHDAVRT